VAKKKPGPSLRDTLPNRGVPVPTPPEHSAVADRARRRIFLNLFRHNSARINSARYESGWRFIVSVFWRDGDPVPCPAAVGHEDKARTGHHLEAEFRVSVPDLVLSIRIRVDDGGSLGELPKIGIGGNYAAELRAALGRYFGLSYPKVEDEPAG
jgi:hypothetical protein